ncbi:MAG: GHKL domain-containing protein [Lachnospiraceae bacterium]|nr:GHKL domain-containing protein [Lachnospiraceae bacterium]
MWFYIYGRRALPKEEVLLRRQCGGYLFPAFLCLLTALVVAFDLRSALMGLEAYGDSVFLHLLFYPLSALALVFAMIPCSVICAKKEPMIPGIREMLSSFLFILILNLLCLCMIHDNTYIYASLSYLVTGLLCCIVIFHTPELSRDRYQAELKRIDEMLRDARNAHYEAVKKSNVEIRRSRHDMKNHLIALRSLAQDERKEELLKYIDSIAEQIEAAAPPYRSGNDIADVILADKYAKAEKRGLSLEISGDLAGLAIESADLVTILSNLLDNAIEAVNRLYGRELPPEDKRICLEFRKNANFMLILESNKSVSPLESGRIISAKNSPDHGFGIMNIRRAVKKYGGEFNISSTPEGEIFLIETEILLPLCV